MQRFIIFLMLVLFCVEHLGASRAEAKGKSAVGRDYRKRLEAALPDEPTSWEENATKKAIRDLARATARAHAAFSLGYTPTRVPVDYDPRTGRPRISYSAIDDLLHARKLHARGAGPEHPLDAYEREHGRATLGLPAPAVKEDPPERSGVPGSPATPDAGARRIRGQLMVRVPMAPGGGVPRSPALTPKTPRALGIPLPLPSDLDRADSTASAG